MVFQSLCNNILRVWHCLWRHASHSFAQLAHKTSGSVPQWRTAKFGFFHLHFWRRTFHFIIIRFPDLTFDFLDVEVKYIRSSVLHAEIARIDYVTTFFLICDDIEIRVISGILSGCSLVMAIRWTVQFVVAYVTIAPHSALQMTSLFWQLRKRCASVLTPNFNSPAACQELPHTRIRSYNSSLLTEHPGNHLTALIPN